MNSWGAENPIKAAALTTAVVMILSVAFIFFFICREHPVHDDTNTFGVACRNISVNQGGMQFSTQFPKNRMCIITVMPEGGI